MDALQVSVLAIVSLFMLGRPRTHTRAAVGVVAVMWAAALAIAFSGWSLGDWAVSAVAAAGLALAYWAPPWLRADIGRSPALRPAGQDQQRADVGQDAQQPNGGGGGSAPDQQPRESAGGPDQ